MNVEYDYLRLVERIIKKGEYTPNRTGVGAYTLPHAYIEHDMRDGFPLLTTKKMAWKTMKVELEGFIQGITDKAWYKERGCNIWNEWCNPQRVPAGLNDAERKAFQLEENDLGKIYGYQWRNFNSQGYDQLQTILHTLKTNPQDRRMVCTAFNPLQMDEQALPPCHILWDVSVINGTIHLAWYMRSVDVGAGLPFNLASYALLLHLLAKETGYEAGMVTGFFSKPHVYENQVEALKEQLVRQPYALPQIATEQFTSILDWTHQDTKTIGYQSHERIALEIAV